MNTEPDKRLDSEGEIEWERAIIFICKNIIKVTIKHSIDIFYNNNMCSLILKEKKKTYDKWLNSLRKILCSSFLIKIQQQKHLKKKIVESGAYIE